MIDTLNSLISGFSVALLPQNLLYAFVGSFVGTAVGVLPGLGPVTTIAILLPITYQAVSPAGAIIMLAAIYYGAMYAGSTTSILLRVPGEAASVITVIDGHEMAKQGRAGPALAISAIGSWIAGSMAIVGLTFAGPVFAGWALKFGAPEFFMLAMFGLLLASTLSTSSPSRGIAMALAGLLFGLIGIDTVSGETRFTFDNIRLMTGVSIVPVLMGLFGVGEILYNLERRYDPEFVARTIGRFFPNREEWRDSLGAIARGTVVGFFIGLIPGGGAILASMLSYMVEKRVSSKPETFGKGNIAGVAGPESANNAAATSSFIPLLTLGLPANAVSAMLLAALIIQNVQPGPLMIQNNPDIFWGVIASMYLGNVMLLILNLPLVGMWVQLLRVPFWILAPAVLTVAAVGSFSLSNDYFDVGVLAVSGLFGYILRKADFDPTPFVMAYILSDLVDTSFRQSLLMGDGSVAIFANRPISLTLLVLGGAYVVLQLYLHLRGRRNPFAAE